MNINTSFCSAQLNNYRSTLYYTQYELYYYTVYTMMYIIYRSGDFYKPTRYMFDFVVSLTCDFCVFEERKVR